MGQARNILEIRLLGQFNLRLGGVPVELSSRPAKVLLAYLLLTIGTQHPREKLGGVLWPDSSESNARKNLRQALWRLRKGIGDAYLLVDTHSVGFNSKSDYWLDVEQLEELVDYDLEEGISVYEGELLPGFYEDWILLERDRLEAVFERRMQRFLTLLTQDRCWTDVLRWGEQWIAKGIVPEAAYRALMIAHAAMGELSKVETAYQRCVEALQQEIGVDPSPETKELYSSLMAGDNGSVIKDLEKKAPDQIRKVILPIEHTPFIGREDELAQIEHLLNQTCLLTLTGPGGIGKTRLAIRAATRLAEGFDDGCFFVSLAPITAIEHLTQTIAEAVKFRIATHEDPQRQLIRYLQDKRLLLVIDNFEHLMEGVDVLSEILKFAPDVKLLVTSREKLNLRSETVFTIGGMGSPGGTGSAIAANRDAISLFKQSAGKVLPGFDPGPTDLDKIANICQLVGGLPLAIELAAAWVPILNLDEIAAELEKGFDLLTSEVRDAPERHRSIRTVFDQSWSLLPQVEKEILQRLSVFRGGFTREAAQQVSGATLQQLAKLVNKSIIHYEPVSGRMGLHELLRQYAQEKLERSTDATFVAQEAHAAYFATFIQEKGEQLKGKKQLQALPAIEADIENVRTAWRYYLHQKNAPQIEKFINRLWHVYWIRWWTYAGMTLFANAAHLLEGESDEELICLKAQALANQGFFMGWLGLNEQGYELAKNSIEILNHFDNSEALIIAYYSRLINGYFLDRSSEQTDAIDTMLSIARGVDDKWLLAFTLFGTSMIALPQGVFEDARQMAEFGLALFEEVGDVICSSTPLIVLGSAAMVNGELEKARGYYLRSLQIAESVGFYYSIQTASKYLGKVSIAMNNLDEAEKYLLRSLSISNEIGFTRDIVNLLYEFARLRVPQEKPEQAVELLALVIQHPASEQSRMFEGRIRDSAKELLSKLESEIPQEKYIESLKHGTTLELDKVVEALLKNQPTRKNG